MAPEIDDNQSVYFTDSVGGGVPPYTYTWWGLPIGGFGDCTGTATAKPSCTFLEPGTYVIALNVTDSAGTNSGVSAGFPLTVDNPPSVGVPVANQSSGDVGQTVSFSATGESGAGGFAYTWPGLPAGCSGVNFATVSCPLTTVGPLSVVAQVIDVNGGIAVSPTLSFPVHPSVQLGPTVASSSKVDAGETLVLNATASGGTGLYPNWTWEGLGGANCSAPGPRVTCSFSTSGIFPVSAQVRDSVGGFAASSASVVIDVAPALRAMAPQPDRSSLDVDQTFDAVASPSGGLGPYTISWTGLPPGCVSEELQVACAPSQPGTWVIGYAVQDANGVAVSSATAVVDVAPALTAAAWASDLSPMVGSAVDLLAEPLGGSAPYDVVWEAGSVGTITGASGEVVFQQVGVQSVVATVQDANDENATARLTITVVAAPGPAGPLGLSPGAAAALFASLGLNVLVIVALVLVVFRGRAPAARAHPTPRKSDAVPEGPKDPGSRSEAKEGPEEPSDESPKAE